MTMILIHILINPDHNPLVSSICCPINPGQGGHPAGAAQQQQQQRELTYHVLSPLIIYYEERVSDGMYSYHLLNYFSGLFI